MSAWELMFWAGVVLLAYAALLVLPLAWGSLKRASVRRRYLRDCERKRHTSHADDTLDLRGRL